MSMRNESVLRGRNRARSLNHARRAIHAVLEKLEERRLLSGDVRLIGITGNLDSGDPNFGDDETLYDIKFGTSGTSDPAFLDGFEDIASNAPDTQLSVSTSTGVTQGHGALRVDVDNGVGAFWGIRSPNVVDLLKAGASTLSYDITLNNIDLNGGSYGGGTDNSFNGYAQNNELAVVINTPTNGFIQRSFTEANGSDSFGTNATWSGVDGTRTITWDLSTFTSDGLSLQDFITTHNATDARFWFVTQGQDTNGNVGPMRFYFDNMQVSGPDGSTNIGDFELVSTTKILQLPHVPDTDSIAFNPEDGLLYRLSGASSYRDGTDAVTGFRIGYRDDQFMETLDINDPVNSQVGIFNANYEGGPIFDKQPATMNYGLPAPFPAWVLPDHRRTDEETDSSFGVKGPDEYGAMRDLTWSNDDHLFIGTDEGGIYTMTADGTSHFVAYPNDDNGPVFLDHGPKGITFYTGSDGVRRLLITERDGPNLFTIDPATARVTNSVMMTNENGFPLPGVVSIVEDPTSNTLLGIAKSIEDPGDPTLRELIRIDPVTGQTTSLGALGTEMADLAFVVSRPSVVSSEFLYEDAPQRLVFGFSQNVGSSISAVDFRLEKLGINGGQVAVGDPQYDFTNNTVTFPINGILPDGNYRALLLGAGVTNSLNMQLTANEEVNFFWLNGDLNRDRSVSISDFIDLASHFGGPATKWSDGDLNYDGQVSISDFIDLASNFGKTLDPEPPAAQPAADMTLSSNAASSDSGNDLLGANESVTLFSKKSSRRHSHHRRHGHKAEPQHLIGRAGSY